MKRRQWTSRKEKRKGEKKMDRVSVTGIGDALFFETAIGVGRCLVRMVAVVSVVEVDVVVVRDDRG